MSNVNFLSLIVATKDRVRELRRLIESLERVGSRCFEVIVIDQSSNLNAAANKENIDQSSLKASIVYSHTQKIGLSSARNMGLKMAKGNILGFPDDDCWYQFGAISMIYKFFQENSEYDFLSGSYTEPGKVNIHFPKRMTPIRELRTAMIPSSVTLFIKRSGKTDSLIEFDEFLGAGSGTGMTVGEEALLIRQLVLRRCFGLYDPNLIIFHKIHVQSPDDPMRLVQEFSWGYMQIKTCNSLSGMMHFLLSSVKLIINIVFKPSEMKYLRCRFKGWMFALKSMPRHD